MKVKGNLEKFYYYAFPMQAILVTVNDERKKTNVITIAWHTPISQDPPLYGISVAPKRYSHELIQKTREFVVNFVPFELVERVHFCGRHTGRTTDKIKETGLTLIPSQKIKTPLIKGGYAHLECRLHSAESYGDHTFFIGEVVNTMVDEHAFKDDLLDNKTIHPTYYIGGDSYTSLDKTQKKF
jgi:flavin reductase (DIM6/NTAB) family NADH-FMN oxidoreductase RutF